MSYVDAGYSSNPHNDWSQTKYFFTCGGTMISWRLVKQLIIATSSNHATFSITWGKMESTTIYKNNNACIAQLKEGYIKYLFTKSLSRRIFEQLVHKIGLVILKM